jgi:LacI family transcriptional regulator
MSFPETGPQMGTVAEMAGVSLATVDRVLNQRKGVKARTVSRVLSAALETGYIDREEFERLSSPRPPNITFLLPMGGNPFFRLLGDKVRRIARSTSRRDAQVRCYFIESFDAAALADAIRHHAGWADGIAFMAIDHPLVREAVEDATAKGRQIVTIISDLQQSLRDAYVGLDNQSAGRTAGYLLARFCHAASGSVALIAGSRNYRAHSEREMGFFGLLEEMRPELKLVGVREGHDDRDENYHLTLSLLDQHPDLAGIYNVGGSSDGIGRALRERGKTGDVVFIGHGLTPDTRKLLIEGSMDVVINSDPDRLVNRTISIIGDLHSGRNGEGIEDMPMNMDVIFRDNIPSRNVL